MNKVYIYYDGLCMLCNAFIIFLKKRNTKQRFRFVENSQSIYKGYDTVVIKINNSTYEKSDAIIKVLISLGGFWKISYLLYIFPRVLRDFFYDLIAKNRYRIFGKVESCDITSQAKS